MNAKITTVKKSRKQTWKHFLPDAVVPKEIQDLVDTGKLEDVTKRMSSKKCPVPSNWVRRPYFLLSRTGFTLYVSPMPDGTVQVMEHLVFPHRSMSYVETIALVEKYVAMSEVELKQILDWRRRLITPDSHRSPWVGRNASGEAVTFAT